MERNCKSCKKFKDCELTKFLPFPQVGCSDFVKRPKKYVLIHRYNETGFISIVGFSDFLHDLWDTMYSHPRYGSSRHDFFIFPNPVGVYGTEPSSHPLFEGMIFNDVKDSCLLNICKNVAEYLAIAEYAMLKKSYFKSSAWFEKAKNSSSLGAVIIDNY